MKYIILTFSLLLVSISNSFSNIDTTPDHSTWDALLKKHVSNDGKVDYKGFKSDIATLDEYLSTLSTNAPESSWSEDEQLAFWINAYNAFTVKLIVKNYPVNSITDLHNGKPWDVKWINIGDQTLSLNQIENEIIRPTFNEPRIHFAVNCAAKSCPPLMNSAYTALELDNQLESQTTSFINNSRYNTLSPSKITISKIFEWYGSDFDDVVDFINDYAPQVKSSAKVSYNEYDWALNQK